MRKLLCLVWLLTGCGFHPSQQAGYRAVAWNQLGSFACPVGKGSIPIPAEIQALDGQRVRLSGYVLPLEMEGQCVQSCLLVRDQMACCFGKMPALNQWVFVEFPKGRGMELQADKPLMVSGRFPAREEREKGVIISLYRMEADGAEPVEGAPQGWKAN